MKTRYVIIGASAAGIFAAEAIREKDPFGSITLIGAEREEPYSRCLTTYYMEGKVTEEKMRLRSAEHWRDLTVDLRLGTIVTGISPEEKRVSLADGTSVFYDKLLIATGSSARRVPLDGADEKDIFVMRTLDDAKKLLGARNEGKERIALFGGGLVSLKTAAALAKTNAKLTLVSASEHLLSSQLDKVASDILCAHMERCGVKLYFNTTAEKMIKNQKGECCGVALTNGETLPCDLFFAGKGVIPNSGFVPVGMVKDEDGFIVTDAHLETNIKDIYAAGDVALSFDRVSGEPAVYAIWPSATDQGQIAGYNMAGDSALYRGALSMNSLEFMGLKAIVAGDSLGAAPGSEVRCVSLPSRSIYQKCVFRDGKLTGYILVGETKNAGTLTARLGEELTFDEAMTLLEKAVLTKDLEA